MQTTQTSTACVIVTSPPLTLGPITNRSSTHAQIIAAVRMSTYMFQHKIQVWIISPIAYVYKHHGTPIDMVLDTGTSVDINDKCAFIEVKRIELHITSILRQVHSSLWLKFATHITARKSQTY